MGVNRDVFFWGGGGTIPLFCIKQLRMISFHHFRHNISSEKKQLSANLPLVQIGLTANHIKSQKIRLVSARATTSQVNRIVKYSINTSLIS